MSYDCGVRTRNLSTHPDKPRTSRRIPISHVDASKNFRTVAHTQPHQANYGKESTRLLDAHETKFLRPNRSRTHPAELSCNVQFFDIRGLRIPATITTTRRQDTLHTAGRLECTDRGGHSSDSTVANMILQGPKSSSRWKGTPVTMQVLQSTQNIVTKKIKSQCHTV